MDIMQLEQFAERAFRAKLAYIDAAGDLNAGILLGQIVYWNTPDRYGRPKLSIRHDGKLWLAKARDEWHQEIRLSAKQYDRAIRILERLGLVKVEIRHFNGVKTPHIWLNQKRLGEAVERILTDGEYTPEPILPDGGNASSPLGEMHIPQTSISSYNKELHTETTAETTAHAGARETAAASDPPPATEADVIDAFVLAFSRQPNALQLEKITGHLDDGLEPALLIEIFKQAALTGAQYPYADAALCRIYRQGVRTLADYEKAERERRGRSHARDRRDPGRTEKESANAYKPQQRDFSDVDLDDL